MATIQVTNIGGVIIPNAHWKVKSLGSMSAGEVVRVNVSFEDERLSKYLSKATAQEVTLEREEGEPTSVVLGFVMEKFSHFLDQSADEPDVESIAWIKPMNRTVEAVIVYLLDRENCDPRFLAMLGAKRREESADA